MPVLTYFFIATYSIYHRGKHNLNECTTPCRGMAARICPAGLCWRYLWWYPSWKDTKEWQTDSPPWWSRLCNRDTGRRVYDTSSVLGWPKQFLTSKRHLTWERDGCLNHESSLLSWHTLAQQIIVKTIWNAESIPVLLLSMHFCRLVKFVGMDLWWRRCGCDLTWLRQRQKFLRCTQSTDNTGIPP